MSSVEEWFQEVWRQREEDIFPSIFGDSSAFYQLTENVFKDFDAKFQVDPMWLNFLVIEYPPNSKRDSWLYVSSGLSNPVGQDPAKLNANEFSGLGFEMVIEAKEKSNWPIYVLHHLMVFQLFIATGQIKSHLLEFDTILPLGVPLTPSSELVHFALIAPGSKHSYPKSFYLQAGVVDLFFLFGISENELTQIEKEPEICIDDTFMAKTDFPVTDADRKSISLI